MKPISNQPVAKRAPQRTCVACRQVKGKKDLVRLVRISDNTVEIDTGGKKAGRGAYLCRSPQCWEMCFKGGRLDHNLRTKLTQENRNKLVEFGKEFVAGNLENKVT